MTGLGRSRMLSAAYREIWAMTEPHLESVLAFLEARASGHTLSKQELRARGISYKAARPFAMTSQSGGQIAVLPLRGVIAHHAGMEMDISGGTSTIAFGNAFDAAMANTSVSAIIIDCDSPGGGVEGVSELFSKILSARGKGKDIVAVCNAHMHSAAYWVCSAADRIYITPSGAIGDIGVMTSHTDYSAADAKAGITRTLIKSGQFKGEGFSGAPLSDADREAIQSRCDTMYAMFTGDVAKGRGASTAQVAKGYGLGRSVLAAEAVRIGLADKVATLADVIAEYGATATAERRPMVALRAESDSGVQMCPDCGAPMEMQDDGELICPECDETPVEETSAVARVAASQAPDASLVASALPMTAGRATIAAAASPPATLIPISQNSQESAMNEEEKAAALKALREQEADRVDQIRALCADHDLSAKADEYVRSGLSLDAVKTAILAEKKAAKVAGTSIIVGSTRETAKPWESLGHFAAAVMDAQTPGTRTKDVRLEAAASGVNQSVPSEGGFLVPPQFSTTIWDAMQNEADDLVGMTDSYPIDGESLTIPANGETSRATGSRFGGVKGYWMNEADQVTKSKPKTRQMRLEPQELGVLIYATDKSLRNSPLALGAYLDRAAREEIVFMSGDALYRGTGSGQPLGLLNSGSLITVAKETSQPNGTVLQENVSKMWSRLHPRARANAVWHINVDVEPQLDFLNTVVKNVAGTENVGGYANKVYDAEKRTIKGRPIVTLEYCESLGTKGDIVLVNWGWYATGLRSTGVRSDSSMHLRFDFNETAFRFMYEIDGQPWLADPLTPYKGSNTLSWAVALANR